MMAHPGTTLTLNVQDDKGYRSRITLTASSDFRPQMGQLERLLTELLDSGGTVTVEFERPTNRTRGAA